MEPKIPVPLEHKHMDAVYAEKQRVDNEARLREQGKPVNRVELPNQSLTRQKRLARAQRNGGNIKPILKRMK